MSPVTLAHSFGQALHTFPIFHPSISAHHLIFAELYPHFPEKRKEAEEKPGGSLHPGRWTIDWTITTARSA